MRANKIIIPILIFLLLGCGCVATKKTSKGKKGGRGPASQDPPPNLTPTCPENASGEEKYCQVFTQEGSGGNRPIDILWVIDNSGSMGDDQVRLGNNFEVFINQFAGQNQNTDFRMMITSAAPGDGKDYLAGKTLDGQFLKLNHQNFIDTFKSAIKVPGANGKECGLKASFEYLKNRASFFRPDAFFIAIYVSDENDHSELPNAVCTNRETAESESESNRFADAYFKAISGLKPLPQLFKAFAIVDTLRTYPKTRNALLAGLW